MEGVTHAGPGERIVVTTDDTTAAAADALAEVFREHGFVVGRHTFIPGPTDEPRRVVLLALPCPLPELVALVAPPTALPGLVAALVAALYPDPATAQVTTVQLKAEGAFASISARTGLELTDALRALAGRVRKAAWWGRPAADRERRIAYVDGTWYSE